MSSLVCERERRKRKRSRKKKFIFGFFWSSVFRLFFFGSFFLLPGREKKRGREFFEKALVVKESAGALCRERRRHRGAWRRASRTSEREREREKRRTIFFSSSIFRLVVYVTNSRGRLTEIDFLCVSATPWKKKDAKLWGRPTTAKAAGKEEEEEESRRGCFVPPPPAAAAPFSGWWWWRWRLFFSRRRPSRKRRAL